MPAAAKAPARKRKAAPALVGATAPLVTPEDFRKIEEFLTTVVLVERAKPVRLIVLGSLAGANVHFLGVPGTAKSLSLREYAKCFGAGRGGPDDAVYFEKPL